MIRTEQIISQFQLCADLYAETERLEAERDQALSQLDVEQQKNHGLQQHIEELQQRITALERVAEPLGAGNGATVAT